MTPIVEDHNMRHASEHNDNGNIPSRGPRSCLWLIVAVIALPLCVWGILEWFVWRVG